MHHSVESSTLNSVVCCQARGSMARFVSDSWTCCWR